MSSSTSSDSWGHAPKRPLRILCLDGGGMKGLNMVALAREIERHTQLPLSQTFDLICGTGVGGGSAIAMALASEVVDGPDMSDAMLNRLATKAMASASVCNLISHGYKVADEDRSSFLTSTILSLFEDPYVPMAPPSEGDEMGQARVPHTFVLTARHSVRDGSWHPFLCRNYEHSKASAMVIPSSSDWSLKDIFDVTTAAPMYFKPFEKDNSVYVHGGVLANNPTLHAIAEARHIWGNSRSIGTIVSLGCGLTLNRSTVRSSLAYWAGKLIDMSGSSSATHRSVKALIRVLDKRIDYFRLEPTTGNNSLAEHEPEQLDAMLDITREYIAINQATFAAIADSLLRDDN